MTFPPVNSETFAKIYHCRSRAKISNQCHNYAFWQNFVWWNEFCTSNTFLLVLFWKRKGVKYSFGHKRIFFLGPHSAIGIWFRIFSFFFTGPDHVKTHLCEMLELWRNYVTEKSWTVLINNEGLVTVTYLRRAVGNRGHGVNCPPDFSQIESEAWSVKQPFIFAYPQIFSPSTTSFTEYI